MAPYVEHCYLCPWCHLAGDLNDSLHPTEAPLPQDDHSTHFRARYYPERSSIAPFPSEGGSASIYKPWTARSNCLRGTRGPWIPASHIITQEVSLSPGSLGQRERVTRVVWSSGSTLLAAPTTCNILSSCGPTYVSKCVYVSLVTRQTRL